MATLKQKRLARKIVENRSPDMKTAMLEVGYSMATAIKPSQVTNSIGWNELMEKYLPDEDLLQVHQEGLHANKVVSAVIVGKDANEKTNDFIEVPDVPTRLKAVELGYKVKGKLKDTPNSLTQNNFFDLAKQQREKYK